MNTAVQTVTDGFKKTRRPEPSVQLVTRPGSSSRLPRSVPRPDDPRNAEQEGPADAATLQERARIARELHDSVSQTFYAIVLTASRALSLLKQNQGKEVQDIIDDVLQLANTGQCELRALLTNIRSDPLTSRGLTSALANLAAAVRTRDGLDIRLSLLDEPDLPATTKEALGLIGREALQNIVRHAVANRVKIVLEVDPEQTVLLIADDGRGFDPTAPRPGHFGLQLMRERASAVGGTLDLFSAPGLGTQVWVYIPGGSLMDEFARLVDAYRKQASACPASKLDLLMNLERIRDPRVMPFLLRVLGDSHEAEDVRIYVLKQLRNGHELVIPADRPLVAEAIGDVLAGKSTAELRVQAALALGEFTQVDGVLSRLNAVCLAQDESIDLRYAAFTSLERAGPTPECIALLRQISRDETLGHAARSVLSAWHIE